jgi:hypothetical protein
MVLGIVRGKTPPTVLPRLEHGRSPPGGRQLSLLACSQLVLTLPRQTPSHSAVGKVTSLPRWQTERRKHF